MGTKINPGPVDCYGNLKPDEPYYLLMGRSSIAPLLLRMELMVRNWQISNGLRSDTKEERDQITEGFHTLTEMEIWGRDYREGREHRDMRFNDHGIPLTGQHAQEERAALTEKIISKD